MLCKSDSQWLKRGEAGNESTPVINKCRRTICRKQMRDDGSAFHKVGGQGGQIVPDIGCQAFGLNIGRIDNRFSGEFSAIICSVSSSLPARLSFASPTPSLRYRFAIGSLFLTLFWGKSMVMGGFGRGGQVEQCMPCRVVRADPSTHNRRRRTNPSYCIFCKRKQPLCAVRTEKICVFQ